MLVSGVRRLLLLLVLSIMVKMFVNGVTAAVGVITVLVSMVLAVVLMPVVLLVLTLLEQHW